MKSIGYRKMQENGTEILTSDVMRINKPDYFSNIPVRCVRALEYETYKSSEKYQSESQKLIKTRKRKEEFDKLHREKNKTNIL